MLALAASALGTATSAAQAQQSAKEIIEYAESIDFGVMLDPAFDLEQYSYIPNSTGNYGITSIDGNPSLRGGLIPSGTYMLQLHYEDFNHNSSRSVRMIRETRRFDFEPGKAYRFARGENKEYLIVENPGNMMEYIGSFKTYPAANPDRLEGTWSGEKKRPLLTPYRMQCTVTGDRMVFETQMDKRLFVLEGTIFYNENTIVLLPDKATVNGKDAENFGIAPTAGAYNTQPKYIWYYTLSDGILNLGMPLATGRMKNNDVEFRRTNQQ